MVFNASRPAPLVAVVDDHRDVRTTLGRGLARHGYSVHPFASGMDLIDALRYLKPDCILLDFRMPELDGIATMKALPSNSRHIPVIFFTSHGDIPLAVQAMQSGAADFIEKPSTFAAISEKIEAALNSREMSVEKIHSANDARELIAGLTKREHEVIRLACEGLQNKEVARKLDLSVRTVESYRYHAMKKLGENKIVNIARLFHVTEGV